MKITDRIASSVASALESWRIVGSGNRPVVISEARLDEIAADNLDGYRMLGGGRNDLFAHDQTKMQAVALHLYRHNHLAKRMLEIIVDFILADGSSLKAKHEDPEIQALLQTVLDQTWSDPINDMDRLNPQRLLELYLWGEALMPAMVDDLTGRVRLGWIDPSQIVDIEPDKTTKRPGRVKINASAAKDAGIDGEYLDVVRFSHSENAIVGNAFFHQVNHVLTARRGISEFYSASDWFDVLDETMKIQADRAKALLAYFWDATIEGADDTDIKRFMKAQQAPYPGMMRAHNEKVKWEAKAPNLAAYESSRHTKDIKTHIASGYGYPDHWLGSGGETNLATAEQMSEPTRKALKRKTSTYKFLMSDIARYAIVQSQRAKYGILAGVNVDPLSDCFDVVVPDIGGPDVAKIGSALQTITTAISQAKADGLVSEDTSRTMFAIVASMTGVEIDPAVEAKKIEAEGEARGMADAAATRQVADQVAAGLRQLQQPDTAPPESDPAAV